MKTAIEMAREAGIDEWWNSGSEWRETFDVHLERFAELVRADEREACARLVDYWEARQGEHADAIRARGQK